MIKKDMEIDMVNHHGTHSNSISPSIRSSGHNCLKLRQCRRAQDTEPPSTVSRCQDAAQNGYRMLQTQLTSGFTSAI